MRTKKTRIDKLEGKVFSMNVTAVLPHFLQFVFDKTKTLHFNNGAFYYA